MKRDNVTVTCFETVGCVVAAAAAAVRVPFFCFPRDDVMVGLMLL